MILDVCTSWHWTLQQVAAMQQAMQPVQVGQAFAGRAPQSQSYRCVDCWLSSICLFLGPEVPISCSIGWQRPGRKQPQFRYRRIISCCLGPGGGPMGPKLTTTKGGTVLLPQYKWKTIPNWGNTFSCSETEANRCNKRRRLFFIVVL